MNVPRIQIKYYRIYNQFCLFLAVRQERAKLKNQQNIKVASSVACVRIAKVYTLTERATFPQGGVLYIYIVHTLAT